MGQLQALIIVLGDIYILHCQILYPGWFWLVASLASVTFTLLIYSLALSFGDVGKALAVVIMVIQIAGSGGTFPIELYRQFTGISTYFSRSHMRSMPCVRRSVVCMEAII